MSKNIGIIFAGGVGERMGNEVPKQFIKFRDIPIIVHTIKHFQDNENIDEIYVAIKEGYEEYMKELKATYNLTKVKKIFKGGTSAMDSIYVALKEAEKNADKDDLVLIHDGVRPVINQEIIDENIKTARKYGTSITANRVFETPIEVDDKGDVLRMPERSFCYTAQAPQTFKIGEIIKAHEKIRKDNPTYQGIVDNCGLMFSQGVKCKLIDGPRGNVKVTTPEDFFRMIGIMNAEDYKEIFATTIEKEDKK